MAQLFLLEHQLERPTEADLARMHRALTGAVARLLRAGTRLHVVSAVFVPDQGRSQYLVEAAVADQVLRAADLAGLPIGRVRPVVRLDHLPQP